MFQRRDPPDLAVQIVHPLFELAALSGGVFDLDRCLSETPDEPADDDAYTAETKSDRGEENCDADPCVGIGWEAEGHDQEERRDKPADERHRNPRAHRDRRA